MTIIRVVDLETSGLEPTDEVVEIGAVDVALNTHTGKLERCEIFATDLVRPKKPISPEASAVHHLTVHDVKDGKPWDDVWPLYLTPEIGIYAAHKAQFEAQWLSDTMRHGTPLICTYKAALRVWPDAPKHSNQVLRYWLAQQPGIGFDGPVPGEPHRALHDALVTAGILIRLLNRASLQDMLAWSKEPPLLPTCPIGDEWRGKKWAEVDKGFLHWITRKITDNPDLVWNTQRELRRRLDEEAAERQTYVAMVKTAIAATTSVADLNKLFLEQKPNFAACDINESSSEYRTIVAECAARKAQFQQQEQNVT